MTISQDGFTKSDNDLIVEFLFTQSIDGLMVIDGGV